MTQWASEEPDPAALLDTHAVVDLTLLIAEDLPAWWPHHMPFQHKTFNWFADQAGPSGDLLTRAGPYQTRWYLMDEHTGTHFDAPSHFIPPPGSGLEDAGPAGDVTSDKVPVEQLMGPAVVIDVPEDLAGGEPGVSPVITSDHVRRWESTNGDIVEGEVVLFRCGWDRRYVAGPEGDDFVLNVLVTATADGWPAPDAACAEYLLDKGVRCVGTDAPSMGAAQEGAPVHRVALGRGAVFIEALANLDALPTRGAFFIFLPVKVRQGTGAPGRAVAFLPRSPRQRAG